MIPLLRLIRIVFEALCFARSLALARMHFVRVPVTPPQRLCLALTRLGTTFIKAGQALSMRRDILSDDYIAALQTLQDHIPPFPANEAILEIERGLGHSISELFSRFDEEPLAAASIAQVHAAELHDGRGVIVKVRRPGIKTQVDHDMRALMVAVRIAASLMPRLKHYQPLRLIEEIWNNLRKEIDFRNEARNIRRFAAVFADWPTLMIPGVIQGLVRETVIVQERSGGRRIDDPAVKADGPRLARNFVDAYLHQIFILGVFHGDPHPGNLFITTEGKICFITTEGKICFHDFGLVGILDRTAPRSLAGLTDAFVHQDADWLLDAAVDLGVLGGEMNRAEFRYALAEIITDYAAYPLKDWSLAEAFVKITRLGEAQNVFIPYDLVVLMRAMFNAEHVVRTLDPEFQLLENLQTKGPEARRPGFMDPAAQPGRRRFGIKLASSRPGGPGSTSRSQQQPRRTRSRHPRSLYRWIAAHAAQRRSCALRRSDSRGVCLCVGAVVHLSSSPRYRPVGKTLAAFVSGLPPAAAGRRGVLRA